MHLIPYYNKKTGKINTRLGPENDFNVLSFLKYSSADKVELNNEIHESSKTYDDSDDTLDPL